MKNNHSKSQTFPVIKIISLLVASMLLVFNLSCNNNDDSPSGAEIIENEIIASLDSVLANTHVPGIVAGVWAPNENIELIYTGGTSDLETGAPMDANMVFRIGSNTKTMTITILLKLVDSGLISLSDTLSKYIPDFPRADEVTIEMLCNMRSGIFNYSEDPEWDERLLQEPEHVWSYDELLSYAAGNEYYFDPGTGYHYSNSNTILIGKLIEQISGKSLKEWITDEIILPLGLKNTGYLLSGTELPGFHSKGYYMNKYDPESPEYTNYFDVSWAGPAGAAYATLEELKEYVIKLAGGGLLSPEMQQIRLNSMKPMENPYGVTYGIGMLEYKGFYGHNGSLPGFTSLMIHSPSRNCTIVIWYNSQLPDTPTHLLAIIPHLIYEDM